MGQGAALKRRHFLAASALPLLGCREARHIEGGFAGISHERGHTLRPEPGKPRSWPAPSTTQRTRVLIAGGGVAGLAAARALRLRGIDDFVMLELEDSAGGNSRGGMVGGVPCPLGAHYLPVPGDGARDVQDLLEELSLRRRVAGRWEYDERHLCHSPQERLFIDGQWQEGLLPLHDMDVGLLADYQRFARLVQEASAAAPFSIPVSNDSPAPLHRALDALTFEAWLDQQQLTRAPLRWYLDYCCRDDYGAGLGAVSAWAGIHYFASRHGFHAPGEASAAEREAGVLTWPEGNGWLTRQLAAPLGERLRTGRVVMRVAAGRHGVEVDAFNAATQAVERWQADQCIIALPLFVAARVVENPPPALQQAAAALRYAPWLVANLHIDAALHDRPGAAPSWDNVIYGDGTPGSYPGLGYVDAKHQSLQSVPGATVLTYYRAFGIEAAQRKALYERPWTHWRDTMLAELSVPHPDLPEKATRLEVMRYGHAMSTPVPGIRSNAALRALQRPLQAPWQRLHFAHSDLSGYSVFEEAFTQGHIRGMSL
ncbi:Monoamine oxidase [Polaromonas sp. YR568]|uniref:FAD-dependent oxidoreductase n=1 Tax=Polaromonas sp. YR568 TaxID=1855301 RepID=UPI0008E047DF|nr:FAD-dependent oxidoreductase [Polaromonas sp. YR568]SFU70840.1 Monoamine oxidase [Polaromonas sp. YR568]